MSTAKYCIILTTTNLKEAADKISHALIESSLAACVQIETVQSIFKWQGKVEEEQEYRLMIKTLTRNYQEIEELICNLHNYDLPQIIRLEINGGLQHYLDWIGKESTVAASY